MPPKKAGKGKKKDKKDKKDENAGLTEVDRAFYELQITDLNRKLARLRSLTTELEQKNIELVENNTKLDEDRADIISYLKRTLQEKTDEINELQERLKSLQNTRSEEIEEFKMKTHEMNQEYNQMQEQLTSEIKLLNGKLNALEEFRIQRDELMRKYEEQENHLEEQELRHKREIYSIERKFVIGKDKLKKEMEARLLQLSTEFQDVTDVRVAATTHRVIRENIAINNELNTMLETQKMLQTENEKLKTRDKTLRLQCDLYESEKRKAILKVKTQLNVIESLTNEYEIMAKELEKYKEMATETSKCFADLEIAQRTVVNLEHKIRLLEQNIHASRCERANISTQLDQAKDDVAWMNSVLNEAVFNIRCALKVEINEEEEETFSLSGNKDLLVHQIFNLLSSAKTHIFRRDSQASIESASDIYTKGDLGFIPKKVELRSKFPIKRNIEIQTGKSFEDFLAMQEAENETVDITSESFESEEDLGSKEAEIEEESQVFFNADTSEDVSEAHKSLTASDNVPDEEEEEEEEEDAEEEEAEEATETPE